MPIALITGASRGLGLATAQALAARGWRLVLTARHGDTLSAAVRSMPPGRVTAVSGDVGDPAHRAALARLVATLGGLDLLCNNASTLGPSPMPALAAYPLDQLDAVVRTNVLAPIALTQRLLPALEARRGIIVNLTSDAAVEAYAGWGGYGLSKAALDQATAILAREQPALRVYAFDPGDMRTAMHQQAFPGEDISDRPLPETVVPALLQLLDNRPPSGRYRAVDLLAAGHAAC